MRAELNLRRAWIAAACIAAVLTGCGKREESPLSTYVMPEINDANCKSAAIKAMPDNEARQKFAFQCARRIKPEVRREPKSYTF